MRVRHVILLGALAALTGLAGAAHALDPGAVDAELAHRCGAAQSLAGETVAVVARPPAPYSIASHHFMVHYPSESLASYARGILDAAELGFAILVDTLAHRPPPSDGDSGGDERIDVYVRNPLELGGAYGTTVPDTRVGTPHFNSYTSWIEMSDNLDPVRCAVVTVHEVYHVVQLGYDRRESLSVLEMFSTWFEERVYDDANLHYIFLLNFFRRPDRGLFEQHYTNVPWAIFLTERYGDDVMRETLEFCAQTPGPNPRGAFDGVLSTRYDTSFVDEFLEFGLWNYFTSLRDDGAHYSEGADYPAMRVQRRSDCYPFDRHATHNGMSELGAHYYFFDGDGHAAGLWIRIEPEPLATSFLTVVRFYGDARDHTITRFTPGSPPDSFLVDDWEGCDSVLALYQIDRGLPTGNRLVVSARYHHLPNPQAPWVLVFDRDGCRNPFDGDADEFKPRDGEEGPIAQALSDAGETVVVTDALTHGLAGCRAVFVVGGFGDDGVTLTPSDMATLSGYMKSGGDVYLESARLGAWVDSALAAPDLPAFWSMFGAGFAAGEDTLNVAAWETAGTARTHSFSYDPGEPDYRVGQLIPTDAEVLARDDRGLVRATVRREGSSTRVVSTVLLGASTGRSGSTRETFIADVLALFDTGSTVVAAPAPLRLVTSYPNPARERADFLVEAPAAGAATVTVYDVAGRRVSSASVRVDAGANTLGIATPRASGLYFVVIETGGASAHGRFLVLR